MLDSEDYQRVFAKAKFKVSHRHLLMLAIPNQLERPRLGLVISKKNVRLAVQRNRIKRHIRETFRLHQHKLPGVDVIVLARSQLDQLDDDRLRALLQKQWSRLSEQASPEPSQCEQ